MYLVQLAFILIVIKNMVGSCKSSHVPTSPKTDLVGLGLHSKSTAIVFPFLKKVSITNGSLGHFVNAHDECYVIIYENYKFVFKKFPNFNKLWSAHGTSSLFF